MAAKLSGLVVSQDEVSQTVDLGELFGTPLTGNESLKQVIGQALIDRIIERTKSGKSVHGGSLPGYSKEYIESDDFKAFNKSEDEVNMTLTGNMLGTLDVVDTSGSKIKLGWDDAEENAKAYNHQTGDTVKKREFFGITKSDLSAIKDEFSRRVSDESASLQSELNQIRSSILRRLSPRLFESEDEG